MKTAALTPHFTPEFISSLPAPAAAAPVASSGLLTGAAATAWVETQPACWRSEAFAEDLMDSTGPQQALKSRAAAGGAGPLLRRALAATLGLLGR